MKQWTLQVLLACSGLVLSGCGRQSDPATPTPPAPHAHELFVSDTRQYLSCNYRQYDRLSEYSLSVAGENFIYAAMSFNAYRDDAIARFDPVRWEVEERRDNKSGLGLEVYRRVSPEIEPGEPDRVVAYEGTDFTSGADRRTNVAVRYPTQYREASIHLDSLVRANPGDLVLVTGHSLGGSIAIHMSRRFPGIPAVAFNTSERLFFGNDRYRNRVVHIYEAGEILGLGERIVMRLTIPGIEHYKFNFVRFNWRTFSPLYEHNMYRLSRGLMLAAMQAGSVEAREFFARNIDEGTARATEWTLCAELYPQADKGAR